jgi:hypothetical protein
VLWIASVPPLRQQAACRRAGFAAVIRCYAAYANRCDIGDQPGIMRESGAHAEERQAQRLPMRGLPTTMGRHNPREKMHAPAEQETL